MIKLVNISADSLEKMQQVSKTTVYDKRRIGVDKYISKRCKLLMTYGI